jgi:hypothetical protein
MFTSFTHSTKPGPSHQCRSPSRAWRRWPRLELLEDRTAPTVSWTGVVSNSWHDAANWYDDVSGTNHTPTAADPVVVGSAFAGTTIYFTAGHSEQIASLTCASDLNLTGGTLTVADISNNPGVLSVAGTFTVSGTLAKAIVSDTTTITAANGTLDNTTVDATLNVINGNSLIVKNGLVFHGTATVGNANGGGSGIVFDGSQSLTGTGTLTFGRFYYTGINRNSLTQKNAGVVLTIGAGITLDGDSAYIGRGDATLINNGVINANVSGGSGFVVDGANWQQNGTLKASSGNGLLTSGTWTSSGTFLADGGTLNLGGTWTKTDVDESITVANSGVVYVMGVVDNTGRGLTLDGSAGRFILTGKVTGGTIGALNDAILEGEGGTLDGTTVNANLTGRSNNVSFKVQNGLVLNGSVTLGGDNGGYWTGAMRFDGSQTLSGVGTVNFGSFYYWHHNRNGFEQANPGEVLTIASGITLQGRSAYVGRPDATLINYGVIVGQGGVDSTGILVQGSDWQQFGTLKSENGGSLTTAGTWSSGGTFLADGGTLDLGGTWTKTGVDETISVANNGVAYISAAVDNTGHSLTLDGNVGRFILTGTVAGGSIEFLNGAVLEGENGTLDGTTVNGNLAGRNNANSFTVRNGLTLNGTVTLGGANAGQWVGGMRFDGTQTITGNGVVVFGSNYYNQYNRNGFSQADVGQELTIDSGITLRGQSAYIGRDGATLINRGTIIGNVPGTGLMILGTWTNEGGIGTETGGFIQGTGTLTNFDDATDTLTGGVFQVGSGSTLMLPIEPIVTLNGQISLEDSTANLVKADWNGVLGSLTTIDTGGTLELGPGITLEPATLTFTNDGALHLDAGATLQLAGSYVQSGQLVSVIAAPEATGQVVAQYVNVSGSLSVLTSAAGFTPAPGDYYPILLFNSGGDIAWSWINLPYLTPPLELSEVMGTDRYGVVVNEAPLFTSATEFVFPIESFTSFFVTASGSPAPDLFLDSVAGPGGSADLPAGVTFNPTTGELRGITEVGSGGQYTLSFSAVNSFGTDNQYFALLVPEISTPIDVDVDPDSVPETSDPGSLVGITAFANDALYGSIVYTLDDSAGDRFAIDPVSGVITVNAALDYETASSHSVTVVATGSYGVSASQNFVIEVTNVNEAPTAVNLVNVVTTLPPQGPLALPIRVADINVIDPDASNDANALSLGGPDAAMFEIAGGSLYVKAGTTLTPGSYEVAVQVDDPSVGTTPDASAVYSLYVLSTITISPDTLTGGLEGVFSSQVISATGGSAPYEFTLESGILPYGWNLAANGVLDGTPTLGGYGFYFTVRVTDDLGSINTKEYYAYINARPISNGIANITVPEDTASVVVNLYDAFDDIETSDPLVYTEVFNSNPSLFSGYSKDYVTGNLTIGIEPQANGESNITIRATDADGLWVEESFRVTVTAVNDRPENTLPAAVTMNEDTTYVFAGTVSVADVDNPPVLQVALTVASGELTLSGKNGLTFSVGDGTADTSMTFRGTVAAINVALNGMSYQPALNGSGDFALTMTTSDLDPTDPLTDQSTAIISVKNLPPSNREYVHSLYHEILGRHPEAGGWAYWSNLLATGTSNWVVANAIWNSTEHRGQQVDGLYRDLLHRAADVGGRAFWIGNLQSGAMNEETVIARFASSPEYLKLHPLQTAYIDALYNDLLYREADVGGRAWWIDALNRMTPDQIASVFVESNERHGGLVDECYQSILNRKENVSERAYWLDRLDHQGLTDHDLAASFFASTEAWNIS